MTKHKKKTLVIVESPTKAHKIQEFLGDDFLVMSSKGHIADLSTGGKNNFGVDIEKNFKPHYVLMEDKIDLMDQLIEAAKSSDEIFLASDLDKEGEAISWHLHERLKDVGRPIKRMRFQEVSKKAILKAMKEAGEIDLNLFHAQEGRRILDRLVGFSASPFLMNFFGPKLSAGRVQSVVARMIVDREKEIDAFIPEDYWTIQVDLSKDQKEAFTTKYSGKLTNQLAADQMKAKLSNPQNQFIITEVLADEEKQNSPAPLITSTLQRLLSKSRHISSERTMKAAQSLYENGHCTYIRTDSVRASEEAISEVRDWIKNHGYDLPKKPNTFKNKNASQDAHECIRPTNISLLPSTASFTGDEKEVYEAIWKFFVASQMTPAIFNTLKITAQVKGNKTAEVKASGKALKTPGFLEILGKPEGDQKIEIPNLVKGDVCSLFGKTPVKMEKKQTQPPARYSEDKLLKELETRAIGRPSTFATLLGTITSRNYVEKQGNVYHPTDLGKKITEALTGSFTFMDYTYTAKLEEELDKIADGTLNHVEMLKTFWPAFKNELDGAYQKQTKINNPNAELCEKCGKAMVERTNKSNGEKFLGCSGFREGCRNVKSMTANNNQNERTRQRKAG